MKKHKYRWHKPRHTFCYHLIRPFFKAYIRPMYKFTYEKLDNTKRPYLILFNHQTSHDQFFIYAMCPKTTYFVASDDLFSMGALSKFISYTCGLIPIKKNSTDASAVKICYKVAQDGYSIALSPEGNRTYSGETVTITPAITKMIKLLKLPVAIVRFDGGYGANPRWANKTRKGRVHAYVHSILEVDDYKEMSQEELYKVLCDRLYVNESNDGKVYKDTKNSAEYMERLLYICPKCGKIGTLYSHGREITCSACGNTAHYHPNKQFNKDFVFANPYEWHKWQDEQVRKTDINDNTQPLTVDNNVKLWLVKQPKKQLLVKNTDLKLYVDKIIVGEQVFHFDDCKTVTVCGKNKVNVYLADRTVQITGKKTFCGIKFTNYFNHYINVKEGKPDEFLGV